MEDDRNRGLQRGASRGGVFVNLSIEIDRLLRLIYFYAYCSDV